MYSLEQLRMFVVSVEKGSFSAAARVMGKAQSAVSQGIANLEIDLGTTLFERTGRAPQVTAEGLHLLPMAKAMLGLGNDLEQAALALGKGHESELMLAVDSALLMPEMMNILQDFSLLFPATSLNLHVVASPDIPDMVAAGKAHLGLMFIDVGLSNDVDECYLGSLPFIAIASPNHPLSKMPRLNADDLLQHRQLLVKGFDGEGLSHFPPLATHIWWTNTFFVLRSLAVEGVGWGYVPKHLVEDDLDQGTLVSLPVSFDYRPWQAPVGRLLAKHGSSGPALTWLAEQLTTLFAEDNVGS